MYTPWHSMDYYKARLPDAVFVYQCHHPCCQGSFRRDDFVILGETYHFLTQTCLCTSQGILSFLRPHVRRASGYEVVPEDDAIRLASRLSSDSPLDILIAIGTASTSRVGRQWYCVRAIFREAKKRRVGRRRESRPVRMNA